jgi:predicted  nucleic acid-binding Zn-ribbon protein
VQELDTTLDALRHRLANLPETQELEALALERGQVDDASRDAQIRVDDLTREQKKADADVEQVKARRTRDQDRMDRGLVNNPKDLERMQEELVSLARRISDLEDTELEVMEQLEEAQRERGGLQERLSAIDARIDELTTTRDASAGETTAELAATGDRREQVAKALPPDLLSAYDRIRGQKSGVGAAELRQRRCGGCRLELTAADLGAIRSAPPDEVVRCEECGRILVRTAESGL